ncbi:hypothetical protein REPUB_Repub12eG0116000 [Reevesia pubescens]
MMDRHYHSGMTMEEAIDLVDKWIMEIRSRLVVAPANFVIKIVDKDGAREYGMNPSRILLSHCVIVCASAAHACMIEQHWKF